MAAGQSLFAMAAQPVVAAVSNDFAESPFEILRREKAAAAAAEKKREEEAIEAIRTDGFFSHVDAEDLITKIRIASHNISMNPKDDPRKKWPKTWGNPDLKIPDWLAILASRGVCVHYNTTDGCTWGSECWHIHECAACGSEEHGALCVVDDSVDGGDGSEFAYACEDVQDLYDIGPDPEHKTEVTDYISGLVEEKNRYNELVENDFKGTGAGASAAAGGN